MKYVLIGAGSRGTIYSTWAAKNGIEVAAIAELRPDRLHALADAVGVPQSGRYPSADALFAAGKLGDAALICTQDQDHYGHAMQALDLGYDLLLEKPISPSPKECMEIEAKAKALGRKVTVCHVLRHKFLRYAERNSDIRRTGQGHCHQALGKYRQFPHGPFLRPGQLGH